MFSNIRIITTARLNHEETMTKLDKIPKRVISQLFMQFWTLLSRSPTDHRTAIKALKVIKAIICHNMIY